MCCITVPTETRVPEEAKVSRRKEVRYHQRKQRNEGCSETAPAPPDGSRSSQTLPQLFYIIASNSWREGRTGSYWKTARGEQGEEKKIEPLQRKRRGDILIINLFRNLKSSSFQDVLLMIFKCCLETTIPPLSSSSAMEYLPVRQQHSECSLSC